MPPRFELGIEVLQTFALPLGYGTILFSSSQKRMTPRGFEPLLPPNGFQDRPVMTASVTLQISSYKRELGHRNDPVRGAEGGI